MKKEKVYCSECDWLDSETYKERDCNAPKNKKDTWLEKNFKYIGKPCERNKNNNCPDFKPKKF